MVPTPINLPFVNQNAAFNRVEGSLGRILVLDALPGYGKTAFLNELTQEYRQRINWSCYCVTLETNGISNIALIQRILREFGNHDLDHPALQSISVEAATEILQVHLEENYSHHSIALFIDDVHHLAPQFIPWLLNNFCQELGRYLREASGSNQFLLIFAGRDLRKRGSWPARETIYVPLTPFQQSSIGYVLDYARPPRLQECLADAAYRTRRDLFIERIYRLTGGHPRSSLNLVQALRTENWKPRSIGALVRPRDLRAFQEHVAQEIAQLTDGLEEELSRYFPTLLIFRILNTNLIEAIAQRDDFEDKLEIDAFTAIDVMRGLAACSLATPPNDGPQRLNPVLRQGQLAQMMLSDDPADRDRYRDLHRFAQQVYQNLSQNQRDLLTVQSYFRESIYHCLCLYDREADPSNSENQPNLRNCLRFFLEILSQNHAASLSRHQQFLLQAIKDDCDISALLEENAVNWPSFVAMSLPVSDDSLDRSLGISALSNIISVSTSTESSPLRTPNTPRSLQYHSGQEQVKRITFALLDNHNVARGSGFWMMQPNSPLDRLNLLGVTSTQVLEELQVTEGSQIRCHTFGPQPQELTLNVMGYPMSSDRSSQDWGSHKHIAILCPSHPEWVNIPPHILPVNSEERLYENPRALSLYSFGFPATKAVKGEELGPLVWEGFVGDGFVKLVNLGKTKAEPGISGSPVVDLHRQQIVGIIYSHTSGNGVYCIPSPRLLARINCL